MLEAFLPLQPPENTLHGIRAGLQEIFSSIQGEGVYVGKRQIFVRFNACHLHCVYCDSPQQPANRPCMIETESGSSEIMQLPNPVSVEDTLFWIQHFINRQLHHSVSFTGGEPLLYTDFLKGLLPQLHGHIPIYLETSGTQPDKLATLMPWVDIIAMDIKLPSATGEPLQLENHQAFYQLARQKDCFIKLVFANDTTTDEIVATIDIVTDRDRPIILQPVVSLETRQNTVSPGKIFELETFLSRHFSDVRVIPQTHKLLSIL